MVGAFNVLDGKAQHLVKETDISNKLFEIETHYNAYLKTAKLELRPPDFIVPTNDYLKKE
jgi:hypothetical protein